MTLLYVTVELDKGANNKMVKMGRRKVLPFFIWGEAGGLDEKEKLSELPKPRLPK